MSERFHAQCVIITGAAGGFGCAMARRFHEEGANLILSDLAQEPLGDLAAGLKGSIAVAGDITEAATAQNLCQTALEAFGRLDVAVSNAGIATPFMRLEHTPAGTMENLFSVNVMGVFHLMQAAIPLMVRAFETEGRKAAIVNMSSVAGLVGAPHLSAYSASKHAVIGLTRSVAGEVARKGIRVNAICPSFSDTAMVKDVLQAEGTGQSEAELVRGIPMRRLGRAGEVAEAVLFAADKANGFMTGQALAVDGGLSAL